MNTFQILLLVYLAGVALVFCICKFIRFMAKKNSEEDKRITFKLSSLSWLGFLFIVYMAYKFIKTRRKVNRLMKKVDPILKFIAELEKLKAEQDAKKAKEEAENKNLTTEEQTIKKDEQ